jgi:hypothetical protein
MRWRPGEERRTDPEHFGPLSPKHPLVGTVCCECDDRLAVYDVPTLLAVGPSTLDDVARHDERRWYSAYTVVGHERCLWPAHPGSKNVR